MTDSREQTQLGAGDAHASSGLLRGSMLRAAAVAAAVAMTVSGAAYAAALQGQPQAHADTASVLPSAALPAIGEALAADAAVDYTLVIDGQSRSERTGAATWGGALMEAGVAVSTANGDTVSVALDAAPTAGETVTVNHVTVTTEAKEEKDPHRTVEQENDQLDKGERKVKIPGVDGVTRTTYTVRTVGGQEVSREVSALVVATAKVDEVVLVGTREKKPEPKTASGGQAAASGGNAETAGASGDVWAALARCESGGNPSINTGNGYYGMYQFSLPTWRSLGGQGLPSEASAAEQTAIAQKLQARAGWGQWPACARKLGLL
ncbi:resuscitation-promoting factor [Actinomyces trachealis]|uniref:resuscitation-promoting factor n=1 Tax=Actinomyces trachealis TaxID=2763540 RepID=UPI001FCFFAEC|nr:resuscitation-promoting factor [Actinomyces trachealis]